MNNLVNHLYIYIKNNDQCILQEDINTIYEWSQQWGLSLNIKKRQVMHVANKNIKQVDMCNYY